MPKTPITTFERILDPMERMSEVLFGLIMALSFTLTVGVATADNIQITTMLWAALGCNLAWGIIDAGVYLMTRINERGRKLLSLKDLRDSSDAAAARLMIADAMPPLIASVISSEQLDAISQKLRQLPDVTRSPALTKRDGLGALAVCLLSFVSTFPIVVPFLVITDGRSALRVSNVVAVAMLFVCGYAFGRRSGLSPWATGLSMVAFGSALVGVAIALGG
jgi:VIT1/CCC1 family predicted Fe2+/Mn2+ transporter